MERCGARRGSDPEGWYPCVLYKGHTAPDHIDRDNDTWRDDMAQCTETNDGGVQCKLIPHHDQEHRFTPLRAAEPVTQCGAHRRVDEPSWPCIRPTGHTGVHADKDGDEWSFPTLPLGMCGADIGGDTARACRLSTDHDGEHADNWCGKPIDFGPVDGTRPCTLERGHAGYCIRGEYADQCPSTIGSRGEGENRDLIIYQCDGPAGHGGVHHNEQHHHAWNPEEYPPAEPEDTLTGRPTEEIIKEMAERLTRLEGRQSLVDENVDRVVKIAENLRVRVPSFGPQPVTGAGIAALTSQLGKLTEVMDRVTRLESPAPVAVAPDPVPEPCPATLTYGGPGPGYRCILHRDHEGLHMDSDNDTWGITGL